MYSQSLLRFPTIPIHCFSFVCIAISFPKLGMRKALLLLREIVVKQKQKPAVHEKMLESLVMMENLYICSVALAADIEKIVF